MRQQLPAAPGTASSVPRPGIARAAELFKLRLVALVVVTTAVGFLMAHRGPWTGAWPRLALTLVGTALAAAGSMALNQTMEWRRDARMTRTCRRPIPAGALAPARARDAGLAVAAAGVALLAAAVNVLTAALALAVVLLYTLVYTPMKVRSPFCTLAGAVCGAIPPMMGWSAATGSLAPGALLLGGILFLWQIPHFLALAWLYRDDYRRGGFRMLPILDPSGALTGRLAAIYALALVGVTLTVSLAGMAGTVFAMGALLLGGWLAAVAARLAASRGQAEARRLFLATLAYLPLLLALMLADRRTAPSQPVPVLARAAAVNQMP